MEKHSKKGLKKCQKMLKIAFKMVKKMDFPLKSKNSFISVNRRDRTILTLYSDLSDIFEKNPII